MRLPVLNQIITGDALSMLPTLPPGSIDLLLTDPPYGNATSYGRERKRIAGDEHPLVGLQAVAACYPLLKSNTSAFVFCGAHHLGLIEHFLLRYTPFRMREILTWDKRMMGLGHGFRRSFENIVVLEKGKPRYREKAIPTLLSVSRVNGGPHPHTKPVPLLERLIAAASDPGDLVLDPFAGSGSTLVAAANLGRRYLGIEVDPRYAEVARSRLGEIRESTSEAA